MARSRNTKCNRCTIKSASSADHDWREITILENVLPYVEYAAAHYLPNAAYYVDLIESLVWADKAERAQSEPQLTEEETSELVERINANPNLRPCEDGAAQGMETAKPLRHEVGSARKGDSPVGKADAPNLGEEDL